MTRMIMCLSRSIRRVPIDYEPPKRWFTDGEGYEGVYDEFYVPAVEDWLARRERWESGEDPDRAEHPDMTFEEWHGNGPDPASYYPGRAWPEDAQMGIRMYETVSEGSPISACYSDTDEGRRAMAEELATKDTGITSHFTAEDWLGVIDGQVFGTDIKTGEIV